jgi:hypothetical protein
MLLPQFQVKSGWTGMARHLGTWLGSWPGSGELGMALCKRSIGLGGAEVAPAPEGCALMGAPTLRRCGGSSPSLGVQGQDRSQWWRSFPPATGCGVGAMKPPSGSDFDELITLETGPFPHSGRSHDLHVRPQDGWRGMLGPCKHRGYPSDCSTPVPFGLRLLCPRGMKSGELGISRSWWE